MKYKQLGNTNLEVSVICLGSMTWGEQNTQAQAHQQLSYAVDQGINFIDTAEMYAIPPKSETQGLTEAYIGNWLLQHKRRDEIVLATKVAGPGDFVRHIRNGPRLNSQHISAALEKSLQRLRTDYIDLYQVHWPERSTNFFGQLGYQPGDDSGTIAIEETLEVLQDFVRQGKVRNIGISNETPWGTMRYLQLADKYGWPRIQSVQNPYSLLNRSYEIGMAEISWRERCGLLAYSPLAFGILSGKYLNGNFPKGSRLRLFPDYKRYSSPEATIATEEYAALAQAHEISLAQMALAYINSRPFVTSNIIGATNMDQLRENIDSINLELSEDIFQGIDEIHQRYTNPAP